MIADSRQCVIQRAIRTWLDGIDRMRDDMDLLQWCNENLDMAGEPRLRAEERQQILREPAVNT